jgi:hypothetical protein
MPLTLYFSSHEAEAVTASLRELFRESEIVVIEHSFTEGADDLTENLLNELSQGKLLPDDLREISSGVGPQPFPAFDRELNSMIHRSGKTIVLEHPPVGVDDALDYTVLQCQQFGNTPVDETCRQLTENLAKRADYEKKRDDALARQLTSLNRRHPNSNILVIRGEAHQRSLGNALAALGTPARSLTSHKPMLTLFETEPMQKLIAGEKPSRRELLATLVEQVETRTQIFRPTQANIRALRNLIDGMSDRQCEEYLKKRLNLT